ncbi:golvesin C-terminal-like domain-containing protein [Streptomyces sp. NBC_01198]|uniref:golvesin C-terminal-like domain-containing protein n=1 Tax=Streptomyces sp. NBC_01198 TaxID=2903769 RepID=UPI002E107935|nr:hypothetical protein OG702_03750 [Streptomyces sp. NBC_01198]
MQLHRKAGITLAASAAGLLLAALVPMSAGATTPDSTPQSAAKAPTAARPDPAGVPAGDRAEALGKDWAKSTDRAWTTTGDQTGFHVLVADARSGYTWRTAATLSEPGLTTDQWIGNACVTGSGKYAVAVYAPRTFTNTQELFDRGAFTAVVNLDTGKVSKLSLNASLAYFDPGCGADDTVVVTQAADDGDSAQTQLQTVDARTAKVVRTATVNGQATSAVPVGDDIVTASGPRILRIASSGASRLVTTTRTTAFRLHADASGGVDYLETSGSSGKQAEVKRLAGSKVTTLARGDLGAMGLAQGVHGHVYLTGSSTAVSALPGEISRLAVPADAGVSTRGELALTQATSQHLAAKVASPLAQVTTGAPDPVAIEAVATRTKKKLSFTVAGQAAGADGGKPSPILPYVVGGAAAAQDARPKSTRTAAAAADLSTDPVDQDRYCSVPRNDVGTQVYQPTPNQVEWAADMAIRGLLTSANISRPADWRHSGLPAWTPQGMFPPPGLTTGGRVPAQVLLGILAQESNLWQASSHAEPGEYGNPLVGNFYGVNIYPGTTGYDPNLIWKIDWTKADCGYGIGQATDGMRIAGHPKDGETVLPATQQRAVALDYATNIAYAERILEQKWNELHVSGASIKLNNDDPARPENWFAAAWNYNEGYNTPVAGGPWGLGWGNNPANPNYPADRSPFLYNNHYADAASPQKWPYEEKVMGWGGYPLDTGRSYDDNGVQNSGNTHGYSAAWWTTLDNQATSIEPPLSTFCNSNNACNSATPPVCHDVACYTQHWYTASVTWKNCTATDPGNGKYNQCGNEYLTYKTVRSEPGSANPHPGPCDASALPSGTVIVDDVPNSVASTRCATRGWNSGGTFSWSFPKDANNAYEAKEDLHQIGGGFGGHYWFSHGRQPNNWGNLLLTNGTWTPNSLPAHVYQIRAFMPYLGSKTKSATYQITSPDGTVYTRTVDQSKATNDWVTVGYYYLGSNAKVTLTNVTNDSTSGDTTVAYDALAFTPIAGTWEHHTFDAASIFASTQNLDTSAPSFLNTPMRSRQTLYDWAHSRTEGGSYGGTPMQGLTSFPTCVGGNTTQCIGPALRSAATAWADAVDRAGTSSIADWLGFSNPAPPQTIDPFHSFTDDHSYKIKTHIDAQWVTGPDGKIVTGTPNVTYTPRTGDTDIAPFVKNFIQATVSDYGSLGVTLPDLSFTATDPNVYGSTESVPNPLSTGITPGKAYIPKQNDAATDSSGRCVDTKIVSGGSIGYRMLNGQSTTDAHLNAWVNKLKDLSSAGKVPREVADTAGDIFSTFFRSGLTNGSLFNMAPPIWQNAAIAFCVGGTVNQIQTAPDTDDDPEYGLVYQSHMPDLYLYLDGHMVNESGAAASGPVQRGDFDNFSTGGYGGCQSVGRGNGGNPWDISLDSSTDTRPGGSGYCDMMPPPPVSRAQR